MEQVFWEKAYEDVKVSTFGTVSQEVRDVVTEIRPGGRVLDLGCGEGRNALFLAAQGFEVTAVDISVAGIAKLNMLAAEQDVAVDAVVSDIRAFPFDGPYDLILSHGCLHLLERAAWERLIPRIQDQTRPGGINIHVVFTDILPPPDDLKPYCLGLFEEGELFEYYKDWEMLLQSSYTFTDEHPGSPPHEHPVNKLVARKIL